MDPKPRDNRRLAQNHGARRKDCSQTSRNGRRRPSYGRHIPTPFCAPKSSTIVKVPFSTENTARLGHFQLQKQLQVMATTKQEVALLWASLERPPEVAYRRRILGQAADSVRAMLPQGAAAAVRADMPAGATTYNRLAGLEVTPEGWLEQTGLWHTCDALRRTRLRAHPHQRKVYPLPHKRPPTITQRPSRPSAHPQGGPVPQLTNAHEGPPSASHATEHIRSQ